MYLLSTNNRHHHPCITQIDIDKCSLYELVVRGLRLTQVRMGCLI